MKVNEYKIRPGAYLVEANLTGACLGGANLAEANLAGACLRWADLRWANLRGADLREADLVGADLRKANLAGADMRGAYRGQVASDIVVRLALLGACSEAVVWAWDLRSGCSLRTAWEAARTDWQRWLGGSYEVAFERLMSVEVKP